MTPRDIEESIGSALEKHPEVLCCYVYGSAADGRMRRGSDVDLAMASDHVLSAGEKQALCEDMAAVLGVDIDIVDLLNATGTILRNAMRGRCVMCRAPDIKYRLIRKLVYDQEDLQPARRRMMESRREAFIHGH